MTLSVNSIEKSKSKSWGNRYIDLETFGRQIGVHCCSPSFLLAIMVVISIITNFLLPEALCGKGYSVLSTNEQENDLVVPSV